MESVSQQRQVAVDETRLAKLRRQWNREPGTPEEEEQRLLAFMEHMIATGPNDLHSVAKWWARRLRRRPQDWEQWVIRSKWRKMEWWAVRYLMGDLLDRAPGRLVMSAPLMYWAVEVATGRRPEPKQHGRTRYENLWRDGAIYVTVEGIVDVGLRKATSRKHDRSACHLVAQRLPIEYDRVSDIWGREKRMAQASPQPDLERVETRSASPETPTA